MYTTERLGSLRCETATECETLPKLLPPEELRRGLVVGSDTVCNASVYSRTAIWGIGLGAPIMIISGGSKLSNAPIVASTLTAPDAVTVTDRDERELERRA